MHPEIDKYISDARNFGMSPEAILNELQSVGWSRETLDYAESVMRREVRIVIPRVIQPKRTFKLAHLLSVAFFTVCCIMFVSAAYLLSVHYLGQKTANDIRQASEVTNERLDEISYEVKIHDVDEVAYWSNKDFNISTGIDFVEADLKDRKIRLYESGLLISEMPILSIGKEGSWWETPTGDYEVMLKESNHFSSIGKVWMPWSIQFYGNFFIHGWPYYDGGGPVPAGYSGGCIRLSTEDAETLYRFAKKGMPILVREDQTPINNVGYNFKAEKKPSNINAKSYIVSDIFTGDILAEERSTELFSSGGLSQLMTAVVASELIYLERPVYPSLETLNSFGIDTSNAKSSYVAFDLIFPIMMQNSILASDTLVSTLGERAFLKNMNLKAKSLDMRSTVYDKPDGSGTAGFTSSRDLLKLANYVYHKRNFLLGISKGNPITTFGGVRKMDIDNKNKFSDNINLVGMLSDFVQKTGGLSVWDFGGSGGVIPVAVVVLGSDDPDGDIQKLTEWVKKYIEIK